MPSSSPLDNVSISSGGLDVQKVSPADFDAFIRSPTLNFKPAPPKALQVVAPTPANLAAIEQNEARLNSLINTTEEIPSASTPVAPPIPPEMIASYYDNPAIYGGNDPDFAITYQRLSVKHQDYLLSCFIAGKSTKWTRKHFFEKYKLLIRFQSLYEFKRLYAGLIDAGMRIRHERVRHEGLSIMEERVIALEEHSDALLARMKDDMKCGRPPSIRLMKEYRETLNDIALELGHRRKGMDVANEMIVSVVKVPAKALDRAAWEIQAQEVMND